MEPEAVPPPIADGEPVGGAEGGSRTVKRFKHLKRSFVEVATDSPAFVEEVPVQLDDANWFEEDIVVDSNKEDEPSEREDGIPVVRFSKMELENLQETSVLLDEEIAPRGASKQRNHRKNNKGKKQSTEMQGTNSTLTGFFSKESSASDHLFVFGNFTGTPPNPSTGGAWLRREDYKTLWNNVWNDPNRDLLSTIAEVTSQSKEWNKNVFGNIFKRKANLQARIKGVQESVYYPNSKGLQVLENKLIAKLDQVLVEEELLWFQKSRRQWVQDGDRNTAFYHKSTLIRRNKARIRMLKISGEWNSDFKDISNHVSNFFIDLFNRRTPAQDIIDIPHEGPKLNHGQMDILPSEEVDKIRAIPIPLDEHVPDALYWPNSPGGGFSVREAYRYIAGGESTDETDWVWKLKISERCRIFLWLTVKDKLLTNEARVRRHLTDDSNYMSCGNTCEDVSHIFRHCDVARVCWRLSQTPNSFFHGAPQIFSQWLQQNCSSIDTINGIPWGLTFSYTCWELWKSRNRRIFDHARPSPLDIIQRADVDPPKEIKNAVLSHMRREVNVNVSCGEVLKVRPKTIMHTSMQEEDEESMKSSYATYENGQDMEAPQDLEDPWQISVCSIPSGKNDARKEEILRRWITTYREAIQSKDRIVKDFWKKHERVWIYSEKSRKMACSRVIFAMIFALVAGSALAQAPGASPAASPKKSPSPVASPPKSVATPSSPPTATPAAAPTQTPTASPPTESPLASPPAPPTDASSPAATPGSTPSIAAAPGSAPGSSPTSPPNAAALNRVALAGSAAVAFFAASLLF
nr:uncharacterized protein LOC109163410 [Ipomoea trifida]